MLEKSPDLYFADENLLLNKCWQNSFALLEIIISVLASSFILNK